MKVGGELWVNSSIIVNHDSAGNDARIQFDTSGGHELRWSEAYGSFNMSDDLAVEGAFTAAGVSSNGNVLVNRDGPEGSSNIYFYDGGVSFGERFGWDDGQDRFETTNDLFVSGTVTQSSSAALKENVEPLADALATVQQLRGVEYDWIADGRRDIGFIAEEVAQVVPDIVAQNADGTAAGIDYGRITAILVEAVKEQQAQIDAQDAQLAAMEERLSALEDERAPATGAAPTPWLLAALAVLGVASLGAVALVVVRRR